MPEYTKDIISKYLSRQTATTARSIVIQLLFDKSCMTIFKKKRLKITTR